MADVDGRVALSYLLDFYGPLLTEHRRELLRLYCEEDLSLSEIAEQMSITRQGVSDAIRKARAQLEGYEEKLGLVARYLAIDRQERACMEALDRIGSGDAGAMARARQALEDILRIER